MVSLAENSNIFIFPSLLEVKKKKIGRSPPMFSLLLLNERSRWNWNTWNWVELFLHLLIHILFHWEKAKMSLLWLNLFNKTIIVETICSSTLLFILFFVDLLKLLRQLRLLCALRTLSSLLIKLVDLLDLFLNFIKQDFRNSLILRSFYSCALFGVCFRCIMTIWCV